MTLALYRKYRPRTFAEIIGQEHVTEPLSQALRTGRLHHAYLFSGPRGCGKTSSARILARSLNCEQGPTPEPCGVCDSCRALAPDGAGSIDVIEIDAASHGGVDDARELRERAFFAPVSSRYKIYVIDEAHMVSSAGFNALLKLVEEPPEYVKFVFATTEPEKVLGTIKSRTHHYPFRLIPPAVIRPYLEQLCAAEDVKVQPAVLPLVVRAGAGSARDTLSVLDQLISGAGPEGVTYARAVALLGVTDAALIDEMVDALAAGDGATAFATIDRVADAGHDARRFAGDLLERLRDLIVAQQVPDAISKGLLTGADDELDRIGDQAGRFGAATLSRMADIMHTGLVDMRGTTAPRLVLELLTARMLLPGAEDSTGALLQRLERMERRLTVTGGERSTGSADLASAASGSDGDIAMSTPVEPVASERPANGGGTKSPGGGRAAALAAAAAAGGGSAKAASTPNGGVASVGRAAPAGTESDAASGPPASAPSRTDAPGNDQFGVVDAATVRRHWDEILTMVKRRSQRAAAVVREATVREVEGDTIVLLFRHGFHAQALAAAPELLQEALYEVLGGRWQVRCELAGQPGAVIADRPIDGMPDSPAPQPRGSGPTSAGPAATSTTPTPAGARGTQADDPADGHPGPGGGTGGQATATIGDNRPMASAGGGPAGGGQGQASAAAGGRPTGGSVQAASAVARGATDGRTIDAGTRPTSRPASPTFATSHEPQLARETTGGVALAVADDDEWPEIAQIGQDADPIADTDPEPAAPTVPRAATAPAATRRTTTPVTATPRTETPRTVTSTTTPSTPRSDTRARQPASPPGQARAAARAAAAAAAGSKTPAKRPHDDVWAGTTAEEPPFDPEFDATRPGFDPGDEPIDDLDDAAARLTTEQQAVDLLREHLGAEKIGEIATK